MQTLKQIDLTREVIKLQPDKTLYDARNALLIYNISRVILAKDDKPLGILTEKIFLGSCTRTHLTGTSKRFD